MGKAFPGQPQLKLKIPRKPDKNCIRLTLRNQ